jgi:hypothetical protein
LYVAGWAKRGPVGIIDATLRDSMDTFRFIKHHLEADVLTPHSHSVDDVLTMIGEPSQTVTLSGWNKIRDLEIREGEKLGKLKEKILTKDQMM